MLSEMRKTFHKRVGHFAGTKDAHEAKTQMGYMSWASQEKAKHKTREISSTTHAHKHTRGDSSPACRLLSDCKDKRNLSSKRLRRSACLANHNADGYGLRTRAHHEYVKHKMGKRDKQEE